jgi:hypothetical protein
MKDPAACTLFTNSKNLMKLEHENQDIHDETFYYRTSFSHK